MTANVLVLTTYDESPFMNEQIDALEDRGVSVRTLPVSGHVSPGESRSATDYLRFFPEVRREVRRGDYDLVHAHYGLTAPMALAQRKLPVVLTLWGTDLEGPGRPISKLCAPHCEEVIVMTEDMRRALGADCTVLPFGIDLELFSPESTSAARERVGWAPDEHHVLFPYSPERTVKNHPRAKRIAAAVDDRLERPVNFQVVHGVDYESVPTYMNAADALLLTSHHEGSPMSVKEAMACNLPVVSTDVGDVRERLEGVEPSAVGTSDAELVRALEAVLERGERSNGREAAKRVSQERVIDRLLSIYELTADGDLGLERAPRPTA
ncbi:Glycosyltransferase involved in cell wall bisynthesis [Halobiforma haloterrestris]|uniref:Glycosyltransferase involved in cell wall bisynthesis n=1 Tax=Natronobacterium haloterrestre TaxID=148448 RepID=A0A1I1CYP8_NATHA|nr:glycosyltransferase [Halobiforma haloterrestris]SFB67222.1 Glycosyltransferase involved in cell wall bisynthesis [Halobiforma haloterrestris]